MKLKKRIYSLLALLLVGSASLQAQDDPFGDFNFRLYQSNMIITAQVVQNGNIVTSAVVAAYCGDELRGKSNVGNDPSNPNLVYMQVYANSTGTHNQFLHFKVFTGGHVYTFNPDPAMVWKNNAIHGSTSKPYIIDITPVSLADNADNSALIAAIDGLTLDVTLTRTYSSTPTNWNTFCVPFNIDNATLREKFGDDVEVAEYSEESTDADHITVSFTKMTEPAITANKPVLLRASETPASVVFTGVTIVDEQPVVTGNYFDFVGSYTDKQFVETGNYYLSANTLYRSTKDNGTYIKGMRAYLKAKVANARVANFGIEEETTEVDATLNDKGKMIHDKWYTLDGRKLDKQPTKKGMYINNGKKVVIK